MINQNYLDAETRNNQTGAALITAIFVLLFITLLGVLIYKMSVISFAISTNERENTEAFYAADAGISHALALIAKVPGSKYSQLLQSGADPTPNTGDELSVPPVAGLWTSGESIPAGNNSSGGVTSFGANGEGRYWVAVRNDTEVGETPTVDRNGILIVTSTGIGRGGGSTTTIETTIYNETVTFPGFVADGDVKLNGDLKVLGSNGIAYINGDADNNNNNGMVCGEYRIYVMGSITRLNNTWTTASCTTNAVLGSTIFLTAPKFTPPIIDIAKLRADFRPQADFVFKQGLIYRQTNGVQSATPMTLLEKSVVGFDQWSWNNARKLWSLTNNNAVMHDAVYYFEDSSASIQTTYKNDANPPKVTLLAEGYVDIPQGPTIQPKLPGYAIVSANDLRLGLKINMNLNPGFVYAYGQIELAGKTEITGNLIGANFRLPNGTNGPDANDPGGINLVTRSNRGTINFTNELILRTIPDGINGGLGMVSGGWREVRY